MHHFFIYKYVTYCVHSVQTKTNQAQKSSAKTQHTKFREYVGKKYCLRYQAMNLNFGIALYKFESFEVQTAARFEFVYGG